MDRQRCSKRATKPVGTGTVDLPFLKRAADVPKGKMVYVSKCQTLSWKKRRRNYVCRRSKFRVSTTLGAESYNIEQASTGLAALPDTLNTACPWRNL